MFLNKKQQKFKEALSGPAGEFLLAALLDLTGFYKQSFTESPYQTAFNEGKRAIGLHIVQMLDLKEADLRELVRGYRTEMFNDNESTTGF